jgi:hypothetical protein
MGSRRRSEAKGSGGWLKQETIYLESTRLQIPTPVTPKREKEREIKREREKGGRKEGKEGKEEQRKEGRKEGGGREGGEGKKEGWKERGEEGREGKRKGKKVLEQHEGVSPNRCASLCCFHAWRRAPAGWFHFMAETATFPL